eukprot:1826144-Prymnesium_polylepis.3
MLCDRRARPGPARSRHVGLQCTFTTAHNAGHGAPPAECRVRTSDQPGATPRSPDSTSHVSRVRAR